MKFYSAASGKSIWRGYEYYSLKKVHGVERLSEYQYSGKVSGSGKKDYNVVIGIDKPKKNSHCNCPHAKDNLVICKHKIALYFQVFPDEAIKFVEEQKKLEEEYDEYQEQLHEKTIRAINKMTKEEMKDALVSILYDSPEWVYERFVAEYVK